MTHGIDMLRKIVDTFNCCNESFNQRFQIGQLVQLYRMSIESNWDFLPDTWTERQIQEALVDGIAPDWDNRGKPVYK